MKTETLEIKTALQILKPADVVFEAIVDPGKMSNYFISRGSGSLEEGGSIEWEFPEFDLSFTVRVHKVVRDRLVSFYWDGPDKKELFVEITLEARETSSTVVTVTEKSMPNDDAGIQWLKSNTEGWANFLACLKAFLEYGVNLRKGGFDFLVKK